MDSRDLTSLGPAVLNIKITTSHPIGDIVYAVNRQLDPIVVGAFDLEDGTVRERWEVPTGQGSHASGAIGDDFYFGTIASAELYRLDTAAGELDAVAAFEDEFTVWSLDTHGGNVYVGTAHSGRVFEYHPGTGAVCDLGSPDPDEEYVSALAVVDDVIYAGVSTRAGLIALDRETGERTDVLPAELAEEVFVHELALSDDWIACGTNPNGRLCLIARDDPGTYRIVGPANATAVRNVVVDGDVAHFTVGATTDRGVSGVLYRYDAEADDLAALAEAGSVSLARHDDTLVGTESDGTIWTYDPRTGAIELADLQAAGFPLAKERPQSIAVFEGRPVVSGNGRLQFHDPDGGTREQVGIPREAKAMTAVDGTLYVAIYPSALVGRYTAADGFEVVGRIGHEQNRSRAIHYHDATGDVFVGTVPDYGKLGGALARYDPTTGALTVDRNAIKDQSIRSIASIGGTVYLGGEIRGGVGVEPVADRAVLAAWAPRARAVEWEVAPVEGAESLSSLTAIDGRLVGITGGGTLFIVDPDTRETVHRAEVAKTGGGLVVDDAVVYGATRRRVLRIDPNTPATTAVADGLDAEWFNEPALAVGDDALYALREHDLVRIRADER